MNRHVPTLLMMAIAPASAIASSADPGSGFGISPPVPFVAERTNNRPQFDVGFGIRSTTGQPAPAGSGTYVCEAGLKAATQNAGLSQEEINAVVDRPEWVKFARAALELAFTITAQQRFTLDGYRGIEFRGQPKAGAGAADLRMFMSMIETGKGRVSIICLTDRATFDTSLAQFRAIRSSISLPK